MYQFFADIIDQLDLTFDQLTLNDRNFDRFAHMLIDNVAELILHQFARDRAWENTIWTRIGKPKHDPKTIEQALRQDFNSKAKAATKLGLMDAVSCESILNLHSYRNTAYHRGRRHEDILHSLAIFYFRITCDLLLSYEPPSYGVGSSDVISLRAMKYLGSNRWQMGPASIFEGAFRRLDEIASTLGENLVADLTADMSKTIKQTEDDISFLSKNNPWNWGGEDVIRYLQASAFASSDEAEVLVESKGYQKRTMSDYIEWIADNVNWPIKTDPVNGWKARQERLSKETDKHKALKRYCDFIRQTEEIRGQISEAALQLDEYMQLHADIARGK